MTALAAPLPTASADARVDLQPVEVLVRPMLTPSRALDEWLDDVERRGTRRTRDNYEHTVGPFVDQLDKSLDISQVTLDGHLRPWFARWRHLSLGTRKTYETTFGAWFKWLRAEGKITRNPMEQFVYTRALRPEDVDVVTVSSDDVRLLLFHAEGWPERLCIATLAYLGPRRHALSEARFRDYNRARGTLKFREKGRKTIPKLVPVELAQLIEQAADAGVYGNPDQPDPDAYLIPNRGKRWGKGTRDDSIIWRIVKDVAARAGVDSHVHALRAAFACHYLDANPGDIDGLKESLGHRSYETTGIYLRRHNREQAMSPLRTLSWAPDDVEARVDA